ncbi:MAG: hypothetical protein V1820_02275 [archaeon]
MDWGKLAVAVSVFVLALLGLALIEKSFSGNVGCTEEAKVCPDGSAVGRIPPNCEFAPCPTSNSGTGACSTDSDCVPASDCHPSSCINQAYYKPSNRACTAVCMGPLDCGAGTCECIVGKCSVVSLS